MTWTCATATFDELDPNLRYGPNRACKRKPRKGTGACRVCGARDIERARKGGA